ncbi:MAG: sugar ABC transporter ATP-binding protein [Polyangiaceae bacterium]|nr:sugar ABC transporter ATP-binding protein [Polyangiaceae bacterium]
MTDPVEADGATHAPLLSVDRVAKSYGATAALKNATFTAIEGEVHAVMGENGAGKSTMLGILAGLVRSDHGTVTLGGVHYAPRSAADARKFGVAIVPQEPTLCDHLNVAENVTLGIEPVSSGFVRAEEAQRRCKAALAPLGVDIDPTRRASDLTPAERQLVCIGRALAQSKVRVLILDEPTSSLTMAEAERVLDAVRALADSGLCVLYVSHTLGEVVRVADAYTVLRNGETVRSGSMKGVEVADLTEMLLGHPAEARVRAPREKGERVLSVRELTGVKLPAGASFELHRGEIFGVFGLVGSGRTELVRAIYGLDRVVRGEVHIGSSASTRSTPAHRLHEGIGMVSEDRKGEGLALTMSVADNLTLSKLESISSGGIVSPNAQGTAARDLITRLQIRCAGPDAPVGSLSGGNQQKVAIGRLLHQNANVLLLDEPTRGIDIGSREQLYDLSIDLAAKQKAIVWISTQPAELLAVCDRIAVMRRGVLGAPRDVTDWSEQLLLQEAAA